ncbi:MAG TPA: type II toxin-antitoxin system VapC family toxin [Gemmata sp.]|nr:type II toxin-antitoxin system VapC family toxin [Gemmata sp.]
MKYLLDTDHLSILQRRGGTDYAVLILNLSHHPDSDIVVSVVNFHEQSRGCHNLINSGTRSDVLLGYDLLARSIEDFRRFSVLPFDATAMNTFDQLKSAKIRIGTMDLRIAAIALSRNLTVLTRNLSDFGKVPGLRIEDWTR